MLMMVWYGMLWYGMVWSAHSQQGTVAGGSLWDCSIDAHDGTSIENNDNKLPESRVYKYYEEEDF